MISKNFEETTVDLINKLDILASQYAPEMIDSAASAVKVTAIGNLVWGIVLAATLWIIWFICKPKVIAFIDNKVDEDDASFTFICSNSDLI